ncbi:collectin-12 [Plakobranchus ocellatus]|uniref:Collectin-12 n=1 Tax=Plakobranchus ocellatus TaxID=259542 RepID=A0AAV3YA32_9GAST|nr:collectin-12 [Plakobranchus ocellatus]
MSLLPILLLLGVLMIASVQGYVNYDFRKYGNRRYYVSRDHEPFNLAKMNDRCKESGGYLVIIDNEQELENLTFTVRKVSGRGPFFTGINDVTSEGRFENYNDKSPAKYLKWRWFQPDNYWGEDCVEIQYRGLNDLGCEKKGRYICEVPV